MRQNQPIFDLLSEETKKKFNIRSVEDLDINNLTVLLNADILNELREVNRNLSAIHDEVFEVSNRVLA